MEYYDDLMHHFNQTKLTELMEDRKYKVIMYLERVIEPCGDDCTNHIIISDPSNILMLKPEIIHPKLTVIYNMINLDHIL